MGTQTKLSIESLKKTARFNLKLDKDQTESLIQQTRPFLDNLESLKNNLNEIRQDSRLSDQAKNEDAESLKTRAAEKAQGIYDSISRQNVIDDLSQRLNTKVTGQRQRNFEQMKNSDSLSRELRESVLPRLITEGQAKNLDARHTTEMLAIRAAERYEQDPAKCELVIRALQVGWPFNQDLSEETVVQINSTISKAVDPEGTNALHQAKAIESELQKVFQSCLADMKAIG